MTNIRWLASIAALAVATTIANAADMPVKAPAPIAVVQQASGYVEVYGGWADTKISSTFCDLGVGGLCGSNSESFRGWVLGGAGRGNYWVSPNMSVQLDAQGEGTSYRIPGTFARDATSHSYLIGGHINWRDSQRGLFGVFAGAGDAVGSNSELSARHVVAGAEAQFYWNQFTLYVQGGYDTVVGDYFVEPHAWFARGTGRYFFTPNTMLEGTVLYANGELEFKSPFLGPSDPRSQGFETWLWEAKLEHRFASTPFAGFVKYRGSRTEYDTFLIPGSFTNDVKVTDHRVVVGLRLFLGQDTLFSNDRQGATLDIIDPLGIQSGYLMSPGFGPT